MMKPAKRSLEVLASAVEDNNAGVSPDKAGKRMRVEPSGTDIGVALEGAEGRDSAANGAQCGNTMVGIAGDAASHEAKDGETSAVDAAAAAAAAAAAQALEDGTGEAQVMMIAEHTGVEGNEEGGLGRAAAIGSPPLMDRVRDLLEGGSVPRGSADPRPSGSLERRRENRISEQENGAPAGGPAAPRPSGGGEPARNAARAVQDGMPAKERTPHRRDRRAVHLPDWCSYDEARAYVRGQKFANSREFSRWVNKSGQRPEWLPTNPYIVYRDRGWVSWGDFLGTDRAGRPGVPAGGWPNYDEVREYMHGQKLPNKRAFRTWSMEKRRPPWVPSDPFKIYKDDGWVSWNDFLGNSNEKVGVRKDWVAYDRAREFVSGLGLKGYKDFMRWAYHSGERPDWIPSKPERVYHDKWVSWPEFLGTDTRPGGAVLAPADEGKEWGSYEEAASYVEGLGLKSKRGFYEWVERPGARPEWLPPQPDRVYRGKGWTTWGDFIMGTRKAEPAFGL